jgi:predicted regulator of Ras-like GTPase activity (Roadblock/LC7/MglB family)
VVAALANLRRADGRAGLSLPETFAMEAGPRDGAPAEPVRHAEPASSPSSNGSRPVAAGYGPNDPHALFADLLGDHEQTALLLDEQGLVLAGIYLDAHGQDVAAEVGAELSGVTDAARRATRHLAIGEWRSIALETEVAIVTMAPAPGDSLLVLAASKATPLGLVRRVLDRCVERARSWLGGGR